VAEPPAPVTPLAKRVLVAPAPPGAVELVPRERRALAAAPLEPAELAAPAGQVAMAALAGHPARGVMPALAALPELAEQAVMPVLAALPELAEAAVKAEQVVRVDSVGKAALLAVVFATWRARSDACAAAAPA